MATGTRRRGDYVTYVPSGETCRDCQLPIKTLERVWRILVDRPSGPPAAGGYRHYDEAACAKAKAEAETEANAEAEDAETSGD